MTSNSDLALLFAAGVFSGWLFARCGELGKAGESVKRRLPSPGANGSGFSIPGADQKMVLVVRTDLPMTNGKVAAQCAHAALACYERAQSENLESLALWRSGGQPKITLRCDGEHELRTLQKHAAQLGIIAEAIVDAGRTQVDPGTVTVLGLGPAPISRIDEVTGHLKLY